MKTKNILFSLIACVLGFGIISCKKSGKGGDAEIAAFPEHHQRPIKGATLYVKFKAKDLPANPTTDYDLVIAGDPKEDHVHVEGLRYGDYFLYAVGYDSIAKSTVKGGIAVKIKWKQRKTELDVKVPVSE